MICRMAGIRQFHASSSHRLRLQTNDKRLRCGERMKVLIVDDDADQLELRALLLQQRGFETFEAPDCASALAIAVTARPDCAVLDLRLPTEDAGLALITDLKKLDPNLHVLLLTGADPGRLAHLPQSKRVEDVLVKGAGSSRDLIGKLEALAAGCVRG